MISDIALVVAGTVAAALFLGADEDEEPKVSKSEQPAPSKPKQVQSDLPAAAPQPSPTVQHSPAIPQYPDTESPQETVSATSNS